MSYSAFTSNAISNVPHRHVVLAILLCDRRIHFQAAANYGCTNGYVSLLSRTFTRCFAERPPYRFRVIQPMLCLIMRTTCLAILHQVPMCVDTSRESLHSLITLILQHQSYLLQHPKPLSSNNASSQPAGHASVGKSSTGVVYAPELQGEVVLSAVNILTNQIYQLLRGATPFQVPYCTRSSFS